MDKILVTGGAGFIGSHLAERLAKMGKEVTVLDDFSVGNNENLRALSNFSKIHVIHGDIRNAKLVKALVKKMDYVFHLAAQCLGLSLRRPKFVHEVNDTGTVNLCMACLKNNPQRLVYVSSSEVYGTAQYVPMDEKHPLLPTTPYGASKAAGELYVRAFACTWNIPVVIVRPFNTYGPRARTDVYSAVIPNFVDKALRGEPPVIFGDGNQTRDFTYIDDTVDGIIKSAFCDHLLGDVINIARGEEASVKRIAEIVLDLTEMSGKIEPLFAKPRPGDIRRHLADISKARKLLNFEPKVSIEEGIKKYIEWWKSVSS
jgi:UDP-glucose 4-epimerase